MTIGTLFFSQLVIHGQATSKQCSQNCNSLKNIHDTIQLRAQYCTTNKQKITIVFIPKDLIQAQSISPGSGTNVDLSAMVEP